MPEVRSQGARIRYDDLGRGEPVLLLLPGWCCSRAIFRSLSLATSAHRRVLSVDLRGHGQSEQGDEDFTSSLLVEDALAVVEASGAGQVVPVALSHAGWFAIELRRRLGARIPGLVLVDWLVLEPPPPFIDALKGLRSSAWRETRDALFELWQRGVDSPEVLQFIQRDMGSVSAEMWARGGREIALAYAREGYPLRALASLSPPVPTLHLYAQPEDPAYLMAQRSFAADHPWFQVVKLNARSHFPPLEAPEALTALIERFVSGLGARSEAGLSPPG